MDDIVLWAVNRRGVSATALAGALRGVCLPRPAEDEADGPGLSGRREIRRVTPCHGPAYQVDPRVRANLAARYPTDRAIGFRDGDLRGWFWVRLPKYQE